MGEHIDLIVAGPEAVAKRVGEQIYAASGAPVGGIKYTGQGVFHHQAEIERAARHAAETPEKVCICSPWHMPI
jgi:acetyl-CoA carboxylase carboxyltransferase component